MTENHNKFLNHLDQSADAVWLVARLLNDRGYSVTVPNSSKAAQHSDWKNHADNGDLFINQRVEVKKLSAEFTSAKDWPFGSKFIVCAKHAFDKARPKPFAYVILSKSANNAAVVFASTSNNWITEARKDSRYENISQEFYFCPIEKVRFFAMPRSQ
jgi:hypothetical protein